MRDEAARQDGNAGRGCAGLEAYDGRAHWYVVLVKPQLTGGARALCVRHGRIERPEAFAQIQLQHQGYGVFLPLERRTVRHARRTRQVLRPLFPNYLFVRVEPGQPRRPIAHTVGVRAVLRGDSGRWLELPAAAVAEIERRVAAGGGAVETQAASTAASYAPDQALGVTRGPFAGLRGLFVRSEKDRVFLLMQLLGEVRELEVQADCVRPVAQKA